MPDNLDFSFDLAQVDRQALLAQAGGMIDAQGSHMSAAGGTVAETAEGDLIRDLMNDQASLAAAPDVYRITDRDFLDRQRPVPVRFQQLAKDFDFFWVRLPVGLMPRRNWAFDRLEVKLVFNRGGDAQMRPKAWQILPDKKFQDLLKVSDHLEISIGEDFQFQGKASLDVGAATAGASANVAGVAGLKMAAGPFEYRLARAKIDHSGTGLEWVFWRLDGAEFFQENRPELVVIAQVPKGAREFKIDAAMQAYRFFNFAGANLQDAIARLPALLGSFFKAGAPIGDSRQYDLSDKL